MGGEYLLGFERGQVCEFGGENGVVMGGL